MLDYNAIKGAVILSNETNPGLPFKVIEPVLTFDQTFMTFLMWTFMPFLVIPAAVLDYFTTMWATRRCKQAYGETWKAFSEWASQGRNDPMGGFSTDRYCYNPAECGYIQLGNS